MNENSLNEYERLVIEAVEAIEAIKTEGGKMPNTVTEDEIMNYHRQEFLEALRRLYRAGRITHHSTVNGTNHFGIAKSK